VHIATIATASYDHAASVMARSFLAHHPGSICWLFAPDDPDARERRLADEVCRRVTVADFPIETPEYHRMATIYEPGELAMACKPLILQSVLDQINEPCACVDADIGFYHCLDDLHDVLGDADLAVTPHLNGSRRAVEPPVDDSLLLIVGAFNAGFVAVSPHGRDFLRWWQQRCQRDCVRDPANQLFVEQRWLDLAAAHFPCRVIHDPGYNVAYWNVAERGLTMEDGAFRVDGDPLRFFHFSGLDSTRPHVLSDYVDDDYLDRLDNPPLRQLLADHAAALEHARLLAPSPLSYPFATAANGLALDPTIRRLAREAMKSEERDGELTALPDPFDEYSAQAFVDWLNEPTRASGGTWPLTRYAEGRWRHDHQLRERFPEPLALGQWLRRDPSLDPMLADAIPDAGEHVSPPTVRELVAQAGIDLDHEMEAGPGRWTSVVARRGLLRVLAYYEDELRHREARVVDGLGRAITNLDERVDALERLVPDVNRAKDSR
jgi:hypothetical protein